MINFAEFYDKLMWISLSIDDGDIEDADFVVNELIIELEEEERAGNISLRRRKK